MELSFTEEKKLYLSQVNKLKSDMSIDQQKFKSRLPFDPFSEPTLLSLNQRRSDDPSRLRQVEAVSRLADLTNPLKSGGIA